MVNAGNSTCPVCGRVWLVTPQDDCFMPACGCYGRDSSADNPNRPCEMCGLKHAYEHQGETLPAKMGVVGVDGIVRKHDLILHLVETGAVGIPVEGCPGCEEHR